MVPVRNACLLSLLALVLVCRPSVAAEASPAAGTQDALVQGTTDFLAERTRENALYIFETKMKDDKIVECYLPTIYSDLKVADLRHLLVGRQSFWKSALNSDIGETARKALAGALSKQGPHLQKLQSVLESLKQEIGKGSITVEYRSQPKTGEDLDGVLAALKDARSIFENVSIDRECHIPLTLPDMALEKVEKLKVLPIWVKNIRLVRIGDSDKLCAGAKDSLASLCEVINSAKSEKKAFVDALARATVPNAILISLKAADADLSKFGDLMRTVLDLGQLVAQHSDSNAPEAKKITGYLLFFAELSEARTADQVKNVLTAYTLPPVSFGEKRKRINHALVTAHVGWGQGHVRNSADVGNQNTGGVYAPIGLEFSRGFDFGSLSIFVAPVDFGYPLSLKLNNVDKSATLSDVVSPSAGVSYGVPEWPVSVGFAYQVGRKNDLVGEREKRTLFFVAFDLPLLILH